VQHDSLTPPSPAGLDTLSPGAPFALDGAAWIKGSYFPDQFATDPTPGKIPVTRLSDGQVRALNPDTVVTPLPWRAGACC